MRFHEAVVTDVADPERRGRLRLKCSALMNANDSLPGWIEPTFAFAGVAKGLFLLPDVGDTVRLVADANYDADEGELTDLANPEWRWECQAWHRTGDVPELFSAKKTYGKKVGLAFSATQYLVLDKDASEMILACAAIKLGATAEHNICLADVLQTILSSMLTTVLTWANSHTHVAPPGGGTTATALPVLDVSSVQGDIDGTSWLSQSVLVAE